MYILYYILLQNYIINLFILYHQLRVMHMAENKKVLPYQSMYLIAIASGGMRAPCCVNRDLIVVSTSARVSQS